MHLNAPPECPVESLNWEIRHGLIVAIPADTNHAEWWSMPSSQICFLFWIFKYQREIACHYQAWPGNSFFQISPYSLGRKHSFVNGNIILCPNFNSVVDQCTKTSLRWLADWDTSTMSIGLPRLQSSRCLDRGAVVYMVISASLWLMYIFRGLN